MQPAPAAVLSKTQIAVLQSIQKEWNKAEADIKLAEQVCNEIVFPSIKELRYGGRRVVDLVHLVLTNPTDPGVDKLLADAEFDCHRARHDAVDAATSKIALDLDIMEKKLGYENILPAFPRFTDLYRDLQLVRDKIVGSRGSRQNRDAIYSALEGVDFPALVKLYNEMRGTEAIMVRMAKRNRWLWFLGIGGLIVGAMGLVFSLWLAWHTGQI